MPLFSIKHKKDAEWVYWFNHQPLSNFKLHLAVDPDKYQTFHTQLFMLLRQAAEDGVIAGFKYKHFNENLDIKNQLNAVRIKAEKKRTEYEGLPQDKKEKKLKELEKWLFSHERLIHNPFTVYLPQNNYDAKKLAELCKSIEAALKNNKSNETILSAVDLSISPHVTFRQEGLENKAKVIAYKSPAVASKKELERLQHGGEVSDYYQSLILAMYPCLKELQFASCLAENPFLRNHLDVLVSYLFGELASHSVDEHAPYLQITKSLKQLLVNLNANRLSSEDVQEEYKKLAKEAHQFLRKGTKLVLNNIFSTLISMMRIKENKETILLCHNKNRFFKPTMVNNTQEKLASSQESRLVANK